MFSHKPLFLIHQELVNHKFTKHEPYITHILSISQAWRGKVVAGITAAGSSSLEISPSRWVYGLVVNPDG